MRLSDNSISQMVRLLQLAILTGTDVSDNFRMVRFVCEDNILDLDPDYVASFEENLEKMRSQAEELSNEVSE